MISLLDRLFSKKQPVSRREIPSWDEVVTHMQDKGLSFSSDTIARIIHSKDHSKRVIILRSDHGYFKTVYEEICVWDEDEWNYFYNNPTGYPAYWNLAESSINSNSFYGTEEDAIKAIAESYEYKMFFE